MTCVSLWVCKAFKVSFEFVPMKIVYLFLADVIEGFVELRKLEPKTPLSKDEEQKNKRLAEAKHINARKRKALADLFKLLRVIGRH